MGDIEARHTSIYEMRPEGDMLEIMEEVDLGQSPIGKVIKTIGTRDGETEVRYGFQGPISGEIVGFPYQKGDGNFFEVTEVLAYGTNGLQTVAKLFQLFNVLERDCRTQGVEALTTTCLTELANAACVRYGFRPSSAIDVLTMAKFKRDPFAYATVSLYKPLGKSAPH